MITYNPNHIIQPDESGRTCIEHASTTTQEQSETGITWQDPDQPLTESTVTTHATRGWCTRTHVVIYIQTVLLLICFTLLVRPYWSIGPFTLAHLAGVKPFNMAESLANGMSNVPSLPEENKWQDKYVTDRRPLATFTPIEGELSLPTKEGVSAEGIVVTLISVHVVQELQACFNGIETNLLVPWNITWLIVYERFPQDVTPTLTKFIQENGWRRVDEPKPTKRHGGVPRINGAKYRTKLGATVILSGMILSVPKYLESNPDLLDAEDWLTCVAREWTPEYVHYNTFFVKHLIDLARRPNSPLDGFDYVMKMDSDIVWNAPPPFHPFHTAGERGCVFGHTVIHTDVEDCHARSYESLQQYGRLYGVRPQSEDKAWCKSHDYPYGNLVFAWLGWYRSDENAHFAHYLYESPSPSQPPSSDRNVRQSLAAYWKNRWGDQPIWPIMICLFFDMENWQDQRICDYGNWRNTYFKHF